MNIYGESYLKGHPGSRAGFLFAHGIKPEDSFRDFPGGIRYGING